MILRNAIIKVTKIDLISTKQKYGEIRKQDVSCGRVPSVVRPSSQQQVGLSRVRAQSGQWMW